MMIAPLLAAFMLTGAADYRERFPLPNLSIPSGFGLNMNLREATDRDLSAMRDLGAKWVRIDLLWSRVEQKKGVFNFSRYDPLLEGIAKRGMRAILILDYGNKVHDVDAPRTREARAAFAEFAAQAVKRYRRRGVIWEIWNEPNLRHFWRGEPSPEEYAALVRVAVSAMREVSSDEWIIGPGTSRFDWKYLEACFKRGVLKDLDAVSVHPYRDLAAPESVTTEWAKLRRLIRTHAPKGREIPMICSEWGYSTYSKGLSPEKQGQYALRAYFANLRAGVPLTIFYAWKNRPEARTEKERHFGLVTSDGRRKPSYEAVRRALSFLDGFHFASSSRAESSGSPVLVFQKGDETKTVTLAEPLVFGQKPAGPAMESPR